MLTVVLVLMAGSLSAQSATDGLGLRGGVGTDVTFGGVAFGAGVNLLLQQNLEVGLMIYYGSFEEESNNGFNDYFETTEITAVAAMANYLYRYVPGEDGWFFLGGVGLAYLNVFWEEWSPTDTSLGTLCCGGGSKHDFEGGVGGFTLNIGTGYAFAGGLDLRLEVPIVIVVGDVGEASGLIPLFTVTAGYRF
jgi:hypothetical protein